MQALQEFFAMGGYAAFVWPCFGVTVLLLGGLFVTSRQRLARLEAEVASLQALQQSNGRPASKERA